MSTGRMFCRAAMPERTMRRCLFSFFQKVRRTSVNGVIPYLREMNFVSVMFRLILAMVCGGMIGLERGRKRRPAGFRTYMLVCLGAALAMLLTPLLRRVSPQIFEQFSNQVLLYVVLALVVLIGGPFALGFWLGGVRERGRRKREKGA